MSRYFFTLLDGPAVQNTIAQELTSTADAYKAAALLASKIISEQAELAWSGTELRVEVANEQQQPVFVLRVLSEFELGDGSAVPAEAVNKVVMDQIEQKLARQD